METERFEYVLEKAYEKKAEQSSAFPFILYWDKTSCRAINEGVETYVFYRRLRYKPQVCLFAAIAVIGAIMRSN